MKRVERVIANTLLDAQNEHLTREALEGLADSVAARVVPVGVEHDPRVRPVGRVVSGYVRDREDGEAEAVVVYEIYENQADLALLPDDGRTLAIHDDLDPDELSVSYDYTYRHADDQEDIRAIDEVLGSESEYEAKKSADPLSVLTIAGAFVLGGIATGFFNAAGADGWIRIKTRLVALAARKQHRPGDQLLVFRAIVPNLDGRSVQIDTILTNPSPEEIDQFITHGVELVDSLVERVVRASGDVRQLVLSSGGQHVRLEFGVRRDGVPLSIEDERHPRGH
ncbi:MAG: hypothetical protein WBI91_08380 [Coriobacteriia bacterium]